MKKISICGAFNAYLKPLKGESPEETAERAEAHLQSIMDRYAKRYDVRIGIDFGAIEEVDQ